MSAALTAAPEVVGTVHPAGRPARRTVRGVAVRSLVADGVVVLALTMLMAWEYTHPRMDDGLRPPDIDVGVSVVFSVLAFAPIAIRRLYPVPALVVAVCSLTLPSVVLPVDVLFWSGFVPVVFLVFTVARYRRLAAAVAGAGLVLVLEALSTVLRQADVVVDDTLFLATFLAFAVVLGVALRRSAAQRERLADLLARVRTEQADRERLVLADQRAGLARDLHDVVAHAVSLMLVQAGAARLSIREDPELARRFLTGVEQAGREAGSDLSALLGVLRADAGPGTEATPSLDALVPLVERMRRAGLDVELHRSGDLDDVPDALGGAAYRVVQESLTNVGKHAGPTRVEVRVARFADHLELTVRDDGPVGRPPTAPASGHGLAGLTERVVLLGGTFEAGPAGRGFCVRARLPWPTP